MSSHVRNWDTADEKMYLDAIGQCHDSTRHVSPRLLLERYLETAKRLDNWGEIDRDKAVAYARKLMKTKNPPIQRTVVPALTANQG